MSYHQAQRWCATCNQLTLHHKEYFETGWGCLLTLITGGLFLIIWILVIIIEAFHPWICQKCGAANDTTNPPESVPARPTSPIVYRGVTPKSPTAPPPLPPAPVIPPKPPKSVEIVTCPLCGGPKPDNGPCPDCGK